MNEHEIRKCKAAAALYRKQREQIVLLQKRIEVLEERMNKIDREDAEVIALVRMNRYYRGI